MNGEENEENHVKLELSRAHTPRALHDIAVASRNSTASTSLSVYGITSSDIGPPRASS